MTSYPVAMLPPSLRMLVVVLVPLTVYLNTATPAVTDTIPIGRYRDRRILLVYLFIYPRGC